MSKRLTHAALFCAAALLACELHAQSTATNVQQKPTPGFDKSRINPRISVNIKDETKEVHYIETNNDPYVYTKTYVLEHADPYAMRNYVMSAVQSKRVSDNDTRVECIKYNDGTGILVVSAEEYRFNKKHSKGMTMDEIVKALDLPKLKSMSGTPRFMYFPLYVSAADLKLMLDRVGLNPANPDLVSTYPADAAELELGRDATDVDNELNALFFYVPFYNLKNAVDLLKRYDAPAPEARMRISVYEIYNENDGKLGADFQSWKNGPGADMFNIGGRWRYGMNPANGAADGSQWSSTKYINFSPKWNSKYLDLLASEGKARIVTTSELTVKNNIQATLNAGTKIPYFDVSTSVGTGGFSTGYQNLTGYFFPLGTMEVNGMNSSCYIIAATDSRGANITISDIYQGSLLITQTAVLKTASGPTPVYSMKITDKSKTNTVFVNDGVSLGKTAVCYTLNIKQLSSTVWTAFTPTFNYDYSGAYAKGPAVNSGFADQSNAFLSNGYGYSLTVTPVITAETTTFSVDVANVSLMGFNSNGSVRTSSSKFNTSFSVSNDGGQAVIGGIEKKTVMRGVSKVPWLGDIPFLGWLFSSEYEDSKKSQIVTVLDCSAVTPRTALDTASAGEIKGIKDSLTKAGENDIEDPSYGYRQFLLDTEKTKLEPLP